MIKAILFDLDGVISDTEPLHYKSFHEILKKWGVRIPRKKWFATYLGTGSRFIFQDVFSKNGVAEDVEKCVEERSRIYSRMLEKSRLEPIRGFRRFYAKVKRARVPCAVVSGGHRAHVEKTLEKLGLAGKFAIVPIDEVKNRKPHPEGFLRAAEILGVNPSECLVFEDGVAGVEAAKKAGMTCVALATSTSRKNLEKADFIAGDFSDKRLKWFFRKKHLPGF